MQRSDLPQIAWHLARTRWLLRFHERAALEAWQHARVDAFLERIVSRVPFYRGYRNCSLSELPIVDKETVLRRFVDFNSANVTLEEATAVAEAAEAARDFGPKLAGLTVGLSSGTSGTRGLFLVSTEEQRIWAGVMLARALSSDLLRRLLLGGEALRVAFFLRANSNLYTSVASHRIDFRFYDLYRGIESHVEALQAQQPHVLIAPARVLRWLADRKTSGRLAISPRRVTSVAETLEPDDATIIRDAFGAVHQIYQCTEGFLGYTCTKGTLHLNEEFVHIEPEWLDAERTRFTPIITDFTRRTQVVIRYRLNDVLRVRSSPCPCGSPTRTLESIEGRSDDVLWLHNAATRRLDPIFPDQLRHAMLLTQPALSEYRIEQHGGTFRVSFTGARADLAQSIGRAIRDLCSRLHLDPPEVSFHAFRPTPVYEKRRRIVCMSKPQGEACVY